MMFTANDRSSSKDDTYHLGIYFSEWKQNKWSTPEAFQYNFKQKNTAHPAINPSENIIVFSSDAFGQNGMDLYQCTKDKFGKWKAPIRLKNYINSTGNDVFPVFIQ